MGIKRDDAEKAERRVRRRMSSDVEIKDFRKNRMQQLVRLKGRLGGLRGSVAVPGEIVSDDYTNINGKWMLWADTLTKREISEIKNVFSKYDKGKDKSKMGSISVDEVGLVMHLLGHEPTQEDIDNIIGETDPEKTGYVEYPPFVQAMAKRRKDYRNDLRMAFDAFDDGGDGLISVEELTAFMTRVGEHKVSQEDIQEVMGEIDIDGDGFIRFDEFAEVFKETQ